MELSREAREKLRTLVECFGFEDESAAVNELFYQTVLNQAEEKRKMLMTLYSLNLSKSRR